MKHLFYFFALIFSYAGCETEELLSQFFEQEAIYKDSTFNVERNRRLFQEPTQLIDTITIPSIREYEDGIRIQRTHGWGILEYFITIYREDDECKIEFVRLDNYNSYDRKIIIWKQTIPDSTFKRIYRLLNQNLIYEMPFYLEYFWGVDGSHYALLIKKGVFEKAVTWQRLSHFIYQDSKDKETISAIFREILELVKYPNPTIELTRWDIKQDSIYYCFESNDIEIIEHYLAIYENKPLNFKMKGLKIFYGKIPIKEYSTSHKHLKVYGIIENDTIPLELKTNWN